VVSSHVTKFNEWKRASAEHYDDGERDIDIQVWDVDFFNDVPGDLERERAPAIDGASTGVAPQFVINGATSDGRSIIVFAHGFVPYLYIRCPPQWYHPLDPDRQQQILDELRAWIEKGLIKQHKDPDTSTDYAKQRRSRHKAQQQDKHTKVLSLEIVQRTSIWGYRLPNQETKSRLVPFIKITLSVSRYVRPCRELLSKGVQLSCDTSGTGFMTFESNILFPLRFMVDSGIVGGGWITAKAGTYTMRHADKTTHAQIEIDIWHSDLLVRDWQQMAPTRLVSFDIECKSRGHFPRPQDDPILMISNVLEETDSKGVITKRGFSFATGTYNKVHDSPEGMQWVVYQCVTEEQMLIRWRDFILTTDPDFLLGHNVHTFDLPYMLDRARKLRVGGFNQFGRLTDPCFWRDKKMQTKAFGTQISKEVIIPGRIIFDTLQLFRKNYKRRSYALGALAQEFVGKTKKDIHHTEITPMYEGTDDSRTMLLIYCNWDAYLPAKMFHKTCMLVNLIQMARVTGVPINYLLSKGEQIKGMSQILRLGRKKQYVVPFVQMEKREKYQGAEVRAF